jgi:hypothetical protein
LKELPGSGGQGFTGRSQRQLIIRFFGVLRFLPFATRTLEPALLPLILVAVALRSLAAED